MPAFRLEDHRLRAGTYSAANITTTYAIKSFALQSDQQNGFIPWAAPISDSSPVYARVAGNAAGGDRADGFQIVEWIFGYWTFGMLSYFYTTYLPAGVMSAAASLMTYTDLNAAVYLNATLHRPIAGKTMQPHGGGWKNIRLLFTHGSVAA